MRVYRNNNYFLPAAVGCAALAFGLGLMSQFLRGGWRTRILVAGTLLLSAAIGISVVREVQTVSLKQRPRFDAVTMQRRGDQLVFETTVRTDAAQATDQLVVTGWGVPTVGNSPSALLREDRPGRRRTHRDAGVARVERRQVQALPTSIDLPRTRRRRIQQ